MLIRTWLIRQNEEKLPTVSINYDINLMKHNKGSIFFYASQTAFWNFMTI